MPSVVKVQGRELVTVGKDVDAPLIGSIAFGLIDRGTNVIQVRPVSFCPLSCIFCSTDAGPKSRWRRTEYIVQLDLIIDWFKALAKLKGKGIEAHIDTVGDPLMYGKRLQDLVQELKSIPEVKVVSMQTHGSTLTESLAADLSEAGLDRINLSIDTTDPERGRFLQGTEWYDVRKIMHVAQWILENTHTDVMLAPLVLPGINEKDVEKVIVWGKRIGVGRRFPGYGVQIFLHHKHGRTPKGIKRMSLPRFKALLRSWERKHGVKLVLSEEDFGIFKALSPPMIFGVGEKVRVKIIAPGWLRNEWIATPLGRYEGSRTITVIDDHGELRLGSKLSVRIISNKHNIYLGRPA